MVFGLKPLSDAMKQTIICNDFLRQIIPGCMELQLFDRILLQKMKRVNYNNVKHNTYFVFYLLLVCLILKILEIHKDLLSIQLKFLNGIEK